MYYNYIMAHRGTYLKTVRFTKQEQSKMNQFLKQHPYIRNFSTLVRAGLSDFIDHHAPSKPVPDSPSFLWEYDLGSGEIKEILVGPRKKRLWLVAKILSQGSWNEIWRYLTLEQIAQDLPYLRIPEKTRQHWLYAVKRWKEAR